MVGCCFANVVWLKYGFKMLSISCLPAISEDGRWRLQLTWWEVLFLWQVQGIVHRQKCASESFVAVSTTTTTLYYIPPRYNYNFNYLNYIRPHYIESHLQLQLRVHLHYIKIHCADLCCIYCTTLHCTPLHFTILHCSQWP